MKKKQDLAGLALYYILAYAIGGFAGMLVSGMIFKVFVFDVVATLVIFLFSVIMKNSSVYDPYWSLTPMLISLWIFFTEKSFGIWQIVFLVIWNLWSIRLTVHWLRIFSDFSYEDWRYRKFRDENPPFVWFWLNLFGIHLVPTLVVFLGMLPMLAVSGNSLGALSLPGMAIMLFGICAELIADVQMREYLQQAKGEKTVCRKGLWGYSRHPNYLGEISVWTGAYFAMLPYVPEKWYYAVGFLSIAVLFLTVSVPMMEKRQMSRRADYAAYRKEISMLLLLPKRRK